MYIIYSGNIIGHTLWAILRAYKRCEYKTAGAAAAAKATAASVKNNNNKTVVNDIQKAKN